ncbi:50S ribosomal protein L6 [Candidatus Woesearchaeota archaeon]|nr:MAG: 50S ribosomal protein L6 [Candidatus Woesearchaeota archaeon]
MNEKITLPEGIQAAYENNELVVKGPKGEVRKKLLAPRISIAVDGNSVVLSSKNATKREKTLMGTFKAHIRNLIKGAQEGYTYKLKICAGHFPMNVSVSGNEFVVKNFLGEKVPRKVKIREGAAVKVEGDIVVVESNNKEIAGQMAADIEQLTVVKNRDRRIFQDGIFIIEKDSKKIA